MARVKFRLYHPIGWSRRRFAVAANRLGWTIVCVVLILAAVLLAR
jgi:hypothetical protein